MALEVGLGVSEALELAELAEDLVADSVADLEADLADIFPVDTASIEGTFLSWVGGGCRRLSLRVMFIQKSFHKNGKKTQNI